METLLWKKHPFPLVLYLEWSLLGIALITFLFPLIPHHPPHFPPGSIPRRSIYHTLSAITTIGILGLLGLRLPQKRLGQIIYTALGFSLSWLVILVGGRGNRIFPVLLLVVVIRACLLFPWKGRILAALGAQTSFLLMVFLSLGHIRPFGIRLARPIVPRRLRNLPSEEVQNIIFNWLMSTGLMFALVLLFILLLMGALLAEKQSRQELALANRRLRRYTLLIEDQATLQERNRIAREIHDSVGHALTAQSIQLENVAILLPDDAQTIHNHLRKARQLGKQALENVRQSVATLRTHPLQGKSLSNAVTQLVKEFEVNNNLQIEADINLPSINTSETKIALYRVIQEALTNISKHSQASQIKVQLHETTQGIFLVIADNGVGFNPQENTTGFGLQGMQERVEALGGIFSLTSYPAQGCTISVEIPRGSGI